MVSLDKSALRKHFSEVRKLISNKHEADEAVFQKLIKHPKILEAQTICCYASFNEEVDTHKFIDWAIASGKTTCLPKVSGNDLKLFAIQSLTDCIPGFKGILEPQEAHLINPASVDVFIVLGLAFDAAGYRLGYGKGFTDRLLKSLATYTIGIGYTDQLVYELPRTAYDVPVSEVITERMSYVCTVAN